MTSTEADAGLQQLLAAQPGLLHRLVQQYAPTAAHHHVTTVAAGAGVPNLVATLAAAGPVPGPGSDLFSCYNNYLQLLLKQQQDLGSIYQQQQQLSPQQNFSPSSLYGGVFDDLSLTEMLKKQHNETTILTPTTASGLVPFDPRLRLRRQNPSSQSLLSTASNDRSASLRSEGRLSASPPISVISSVNSSTNSSSSISPSLLLLPPSSTGLMGGSTSTAPVSGASAAAGGPHAAVLFSSASTASSPNNNDNNSTNNNNMFDNNNAFDNNLLAANNNNNSSNNDNNSLSTARLLLNAAVPADSVPSGPSAGAGTEMLVPSNDKEGWCRNKKYIQIVKKGYRCTVCNKVYGRYNSVSYHVTIYHRNPPIRCEEDGCQFTTREARYIHFHKYYRHQIPLPESIDLASRKCPLLRCKHVSKSPAMLEKHMQRHVVDCLHDGVYECAECSAGAPAGPFTALSYEAMFEHLRDVHTAGGVSGVPAVGPTKTPPAAAISPAGAAMEFADPGEQDRPVENNEPGEGPKPRTGKSPPSHPCAQCPYRGRTLSNLEHHKLTKHGLNPFQPKIVDEPAKISSYSEIASLSALKSIPSWNEAVMEDLTNFASVTHQQEQQRQQLQRLYELQLLQQQQQQKPAPLSLSPGGLQFGGLLPAGLGFGAGAGAVGIGAEALAGLGLIQQQIRASPEHFVRAFEQLLSAQKALFANSPS